MKIIESINFSHMDLIFTEIYAQPLAKKPK